MSVLSSALRADRVAALLEEGLTPPLVQRLLDSKTLWPRLEALLANQLGPVPPGTPVQSFVGKDSAAVALLCQQAGSVWHGAAVLRLLDGGVIRDLTTRLGFDPRPIAARHRPLTPPQQADPDEQTLAGRVMADGAGCVAAWCDALPLPADAYARLCLPPGLVATALHAAYGPSIVSALLEQPRA